MEGLIMFKIENIEKEKKEEKKEVPSKDFQKITQPSPIQTQIPVNNSTWKHFYKSFTITGDEIERINHKGLQEFNGFKSYRPYFKFPFLVKLHRHVENGTL